MTTTDADNIMGFLEKTATDQRLHVKWPHFPTTTFLGIDDEGWEYAHDLKEGMFWRITPCCGASDKGMEWGVGCRACYGEIPDEVSWGVSLGGKELDLFGKPVWG